MEIWLLWLVWVSCEWQDVFYTENSISILVFTHHKSLILYFHIFTIFIYFTIETQVMKSSLTAKTRVPCTVDVWITSELTVNASRILFSPAQPSWIDQGAFMRSRGLSRFVTLIFLNPPPVSLHAYVFPHLVSPDVFEIYVYFTSRSHGTDERTGSSSHLKHEWENADNCSSEKWFEIMWTVTSAMQVGWWFTICLDKILLKWFRVICKLQFSHDKAVFNWLSKVIRICFSLVLLHSLIGY